MVGSFLEAVCLDLEFYNVYIEFYNVQKLDGWEGICRKENL